MLLLLLQWRGGLPLVLSLQSLQHQRAGINLSLALGRGTLTAESCCWLLS
jgi:hypothetical protein